MRRSIYILLTACLLWIANSTLCAGDLSWISVEIKGISPGMISELRSQLSLTDPAVRTSHLSPDQLTIYTSEDQDTILKLLGLDGYYSAKVKTTITRPTPQTYHVLYRITLGPPTIIADVTIKLQGVGSHDIELQTLRAQSETLVGERFKQKTYEALKASLQQTAIDRGFFEAKLTQHEARISRYTHQAHIDFTLVTGPQYYFGATTFQQKGFTFSTDFLKRYIQYQPGEPFSKQQLRQLQNQLNNTIYFTDVDVNTKLNSTQKTVPIQIDLNADKSHRFIVGAGYGTETGPRALLGWNFRHITNTGQYLVTRAEISRLYTNFGASYIFPGTDPVNDYTSINVGQSYSDIIPYTSLETAFGVTYVKRLSRLFNLTLGVHEQISQSTINTSNQAIHSYYVLPSASLDFNDYHRHGYWYAGGEFHWQATGTIKNPASSEDLLRSVFDMKYRIAITQNLSLQTHNMMGALSTNNFNQLSPTLRFYAGGVNNVRGYAYKSLSPMDTNGGLIGGHYLLMGQITLAQHIVDDFSVLAFYNVGNAFNSWHQIRGAQGAGVGVSWRTAIGPLEFYLSRPIWNNQVNQWRFDFNVGANF